MAYAVQTNRFYSALLLILPNLPFTNMDVHVYVTIVVLLCCLKTGAQAGPHEVRLINDLLANYNSYERPAKVDGEPLKVEFQMTLSSIIDVVSSINIELTILWQA